MNKVPLNTSAASGVALSFRDGDTKMLMMKRAGEGFWCHVAGSIENDETPPQTICREFLEETGVVVTELYSADYLEQFYERKRNSITIIPVFVAILASDIEITLNPEHTEYKWCSLEEAKKLAAFPSQRTLYEHVWSSFVLNEPSEFMKVGLE